MMTINELKTKQFGVVKKGYSPEEVDRFKREVIAQLESVQAEKNELMQKMEVLVNKIEEYRNDEDSIREALLGAQKLGKQVSDDAKKQAEELVSGAQQQADETMSLAKAESEQLIGDSKAVAQELLLKAKSESKRMLSEAQQGVDTIIRNSKYDIDKEQAHLIRLQRKVSSFKAEVLELYRNHIDLIKDLPEVEAQEESSHEEAKVIEKRIYEQKPTTEEVKAETTTTAVAEVEEGAGVDQTQEVEMVKHNVLQDTVEIARSGGPKRQMNGDLLFGGKRD